MAEIFTSPDLIIQEYTVGNLQTHCYFLINPQTLETVIIDPGDDGDFLSEQIVNNNFNLIGTLITHGHFDHTGGALPLRLNFPDAPLMIPKQDLPLYKNGDASATYFGAEIDPLPPPTHLLDTSQPLTLPQKLQQFFTPWQWFFLPGHTPGHLGLFHPKHHLLIGGDVLFVDSQVGRTDFKYADSKLLKKSIQDNLLDLPNNTAVLPGHEEFFALDDSYKQNLKATLEFM